MIYIFNDGCRGKNNTFLNQELGPVIMSYLFLFTVIFFTFKRIGFYRSYQFFKKKNEYGYVLTKNGLYEHREKVRYLVGRKLFAYEEVHHINGKTWDNRRRNLALMTKQNHEQWHARLDWMHSNKMFPSVGWQRRKLVEEFSADIF